MTARVVLTGSGGRMGKAVLSLAAETEGIDVVYGIDPREGTSFAACGVKADVVIDFSSPEALVDELSFCVQRELPLILAATGHGPSSEALVKVASEKIAVLKAANLCYGALALARIARLTRDLLPAGYDATLIETHHRAKKDAPSGTAKMLAGAMGMPDMQMLSVRGGGVIGVHEIQFLADMDGVTLRHEAFDRRVFAKGALDAAQWILHCAPGLYTMEDMLF